MDYRWFGAIHLIAAVVWVSGLLLLAITAYIYSENQHGNAVDKSWFRHILKWNRKVITPAMLVLWGCGIVLISKAGLFHSWILFFCRPCTARSRNRYECWQAVNILTPG